MYHSKKISYDVSFLLLYRYIYIYIYIYISVHPFQPSFLVGPLDTIQHPHKVDVSMCRSPYKNVSYEFVFISLAVPSMSCSSYLEGLCDGK